MDEYERAMKKVKKYLKNKSSDEIKKDIINCMNSEDKRLYNKKIFNNKNRCITKKLKVRRYTKFIRKQLMVYEYYVFNIGLSNKFNINEVIVYYNDKNNKLIFEFDINNPRFKKYNIYHIGKFSRTCTNKKYKTYIRHKRLLLKDIPINWDKEYIFTYWPNKKYAEIKL
jgi:uncharacterized membrane protein YgaE (UPF0421/DUF939 family)